MILDDAKALADKLRDSDEYKTYLAAKERAFANPSTAALLNEFFALRKRFYALRQCDEQDDLLEKKLIKMSDVLQFDADAAAYLLAELHLNELLGNIIMTLAAGIDFHIIGDA